MTLKMIRCLVLMCFWWWSVYGQNPSPCPSVFHYEHSNYQGRWDGVIRLQTDEELSGVFVTVVLDRNAEALINWFGETVTRNNREFTIRNNDYILVPGINVTLKFYVEFTDREIPSLITIRLNGRTICSDRKKVKPIPSPTPFVSIKITPKPTTPYSYESTTTTRVYSRFGPADTTRPTYTNNSTIQELIGEIFQNPGHVSQSQTTYRPTTEPHYDPNRFIPATKTTRTPQYVQSDWNAQNKETQNRYPNSNSANSRNKPSRVEENASPLSNRNTDTAQPLNNLGVVNPHGRCGRPSNINASPLILYGQNSTEGEFPWHLALYMNNRGTLKYICGGSLISDRFLVTAAHCVTSRDTGEPHSPNNFLVYIGTASIKNFAPAVQTAQISRIRIHPDYNRQNFLDDIAVLKTTKPLDFTSYVKPVCMWEGKDDLSEVVGVIGTVVGWGLDENGRLSEILKRTEMPIVDTVKCIYSNPDFFAKYTSFNTYCAGFRNGSSACNGDSGSGMVISKRDNSGDIVWFLRGLVSVSVPIKEKIICNPFEYIVFTDVAKYVGWIKRVMKVD